MNIIKQRSGKAFYLKKNQFLKVIDIEGEQVSDLFCFKENDYESYLSNGRTIDYNSKVFFTTGDTLYSSKSEKFLEIVDDTVKSHDFTLTPCSHETFSILYEDYSHRGCEGNLIAAFKDLDSQFSVKCLPTTFNIFMNVPIDLSGKINVLPPKSKANDYIIFKSLTNLVVGLTSCSAPGSNNGSFKPIGYEILDHV